MKKISIVFIFFVLAGSAFWYFSRGGRTNDEQNNINTNNSTPTVVDDGSVIEGWPTYTNSEYGFSAQYPADWEVQESLKPQDMTALHEISIHAKEYETFRPSFTISIYTNEEGLSLSKWWDARLKAADAESAACRAENGDEAPCLYLRDILRGSETVTVGGAPAHRVRLFQFDSEGECNYFAKNEYIFGLCYDGENPNDPNFEANNAIYRDILDSFALVKSASPLIGKWQSTEDALAFKNIKDGGVFEEEYDGEVLSEGTWTVDGEDGRYELLVTSDGEVFEYTIMTVNTDHLTLMYLPRGNVLDYTRVRE